MGDVNADLIALYQTVRSGWIVWVMLLFVGMLVWLFLPGRRKALEEAARIPLDDDLAKDR